MDFVLNLKIDLYRDGGFSESNDERPTQSPLFFAFVAEENSSGWVLCLNEFLRSKLKMLKQSIAHLHEKKSAFKDLVDIFLINRHNIAQVVCDGWIWNKTFFFHFWIHPPAKSHLFSCRMLTKEQITSKVENKKRSMLLSLFIALTMVNDTFFLCLIGGFASFSFQFHRKSQLLL